MAFCPGCGAPADHPEPTDLRCECGFLLGKLSEKFIEIKCRRCKRLVFIPYDDLSARFLDLKRYPREPRPTRTHSGGSPGKAVCAVCGRTKPNLIYGKCLECRTASIKVQYRGRTR
jgi:hypothetical protein